MRVFFSFFLTKILFSFYFVVIILINNLEDLVYQDNDHVYLIKILKSYAIVKLKKDSGKPLKAYHNVKYGK